MRTVEVWEAVQRRLRQLLPDHDIRRSYADIPDFEEARQSEKPIVMLNLDGKWTKELSLAKVLDVYEFSAWVLQYIPEQDEADITARMDSAIDTFDMITEGFTRCKWEDGGQILTVSGETESEGNSLYDRTDLENFSLYSLLFSMTVEVPREIAR